MLGRPRPNKSCNPTHPYAEQSWLVNCFICLLEKKEGKDKILGVESYFFDPVSAQTPYSGPVCGDMTLLVDWTPLTALGWAALP